MSAIDTAGRLTQGGLGIALGIGSAGFMLGTASGAPTADLRPVLLAGASVFPLCAGAAALEEAVVGPGCRSDLGRAAQVGVALLAIGAAAGAIRLGGELDLLGDAPPGKPLRGGARPRTP